MNLERLKAKLIEHEGLRLKPYHCPAGKLTIGIGRNLEDVGISKEEAEILFKNDIDRTLILARKIFGDWENIDDVRQEVIMNMIFNLGPKSFSSFKKMINYINSGDWMKASDEMLASKWAKQVPKRAYELALAMKTGRI